MRKTNSFISLIHNYENSMISIILHLKHPQHLQIGVVIGKIMHLLDCRIVNHHLFCLQNGA